MKTLMKVLPLTVALLTASAMAADSDHTVSANIAVTSNYVWRGVTQTDDSAAVSGGIDYERASGFYAGVWSSNVDFGETGAETDLYLGYGGGSGDFSYGVGYVYYYYSGFDDVNFGEVTVDVSWKWLSAGVAYTANNEDANDSVGFEEGDVFGYLSVSGDLGEDWGASATDGYSDFDSDGTAGALESYGYWQVDVTKAVGDFGDFTWSLIKADDESGDDDSKIVVGWSKSF